MKHRVRKAEHQLIRFALIHYYQLPSNTLVTYHDGIGGLGVVRTWMFMRDGKGIVVSDRHAQNIMHQVALMMLKTAYQELFAEEQE